MRVPFMRPRQRDCSILPLLPAIARRSPASPGRLHPAVVGRRVRRTACGENRVRLCRLRDRQCQGRADGLRCWRVSQQAKPRFSTVAVAEPSAPVLGRQLMEAVLRRLHALRAEALFLEVDETNLAAIALYRRLGFRDVGKRPAYYDTTDGRKATRLSCGAIFASREVEEHGVGLIRVHPQGLGPARDDRCDPDHGAVQYVVLRTRLFDVGELPGYGIVLLARGLGLRVHVVGTMTTERPADRIQPYLLDDIMVLGGLADVTFIAIRSRRLAGVRLFVEASKNRVHRPRAATPFRRAGRRDCRRMAANDAVVPFAEGSTGDGNRPLPFKTTLFSAARHGSAGRPLSWLTSSRMASPTRD